jgi:hypothetical protein
MFPAKIELDCFMRIVKTETSLHIKSQLIADSTHWYRLCYQLHLPYPSIELVTADLSNVVSFIVLFSQEQT